MTSFNRINITLSAEELRALITAAQSEMRHPRDHARYILRQALLGKGSNGATANAKAAEMTQREGSHA